MPLLIIRKIFITHNNYFWASKSNNHKLFPSPKYILKMNVGIKWIKTRTKVTINFEILLHLKFCDPWNTTLNCLVHTSFLGHSNRYDILKNINLVLIPFYEPLSMFNLLPSTYILGPQLLRLRQTSWNRSLGGIPGHEEQFVKVHIDGWQSSTCQLVNHSLSFTTSRDHESSFVSIIFRK